MINNTLFRPSRIRKNRKKFNPEGFDWAATLRARENAPKVTTPPAPKSDFSKIYTNAVSDFKPVELVNLNSEGDKQVVIRAAYKQVFGNAHLMDSEKSPKAESQLRNGQITVLEFVRLLAKSERYKKLFFDSCTNLRAIELNFKHLLGRAPENDEISEHIKIIAEGGFEAEIDSYLDSDEYCQNFGTDVVPYYRGYQSQTGQSLPAYTHSYKLLRGASSSDKSDAIDYSPQIQSELLENKATDIKPLAMLPVSEPTIKLDRPAGEIPSKYLDINSYKYKTAEFLSTPITTNNWVQEYKTPEAAKSQPVKLFDGADDEQLHIVIRAAYKQVFGNAHLMENQRLLSAESKLKDGQFTIQDFIRELAKSDLYRSLFFDNCSNVRAIELNFKHLLGRAPENAEEISEHSKILLEQGLDAEIDSYIDSPEYAENFGDDIVPYYVAYKTQTGKKVTGYNSILKLTKSSPDSDRTVGNSIKSSQGSQIQKPLMEEARAKVVIDFDSYYAASKRAQIKSKPSTFVPQNQYPLYNESSSIQRAITSKTHYQDIINSGAVEYLPGSSEQDIEVVIKALYKQVLGNAHVMEYERLTSAESQLKQGNLSVREFVRCLAKSELYKSLFINNCPPYRSHELNFKHLLGRAPDSHEEMVYHGDILATQGYDADIDSYIDSQEYQEAFGENIVPYYRGYETQNGQSLLGYSNMFKLTNSLSTSDKATLNANKLGLQKQLMTNTPAAVPETITASPSFTIPITDTVALIRKVLNLA